MYYSTTLMPQPERCDVCTHYHNMLPVASRVTTQPLIVIVSIFTSCPKMNFQKRLQEVHTSQRNTSKKLHRLTAKIAASLPRRMGWTWMKHLMLKSKQKWSSVAKRLSSSRLLSACLLAATALAASHFDNRQRRWHDKVGPLSPASHIQNHRRVWLPCSSILNAHSRY